MNKQKKDLILACENINKAYQDNINKIEVLKNLNFGLYNNEKVAIIGSSGSGKTTLLNILSGIETPDIGKVLIENNDFSDLTEKKREIIRNKKLGIVFQFHYLLPEFSAAENVAMPLLIAGVNFKQAIAKSRELLAEVGLEKRYTHRPSELSGGERQRVAIARALINNPCCVLADEPTGNLDPRTANKIYQQFLKINDQYKTSFIIVTHDITLTKDMDRVLKLDQGKLIDVS